MKIVAAPPQADPLAPPQRRGTKPNKYMPHEGKRQCARQARQLAAGIIRLQHHVVPPVQAQDWGTGR